MLAAATTLAGTEANQQHPAAAADGVAEATSEQASMCLTVLDLTQVDIFIKKKKSQVDMLVWYTRVTSL